MKKHFTVNNKVFLTGLSLFCAVAMFLVYGCKKKDKTAEETPVVEVATPVIDSVTIYNSYPATIISDSQADVVAKVNGQIVSRNFKPGSYVTKGQVLYVIDSKTYQASVNQSRAQLASARSQLDYATKHLAALREAYKTNAVSEMEVAQAESARSQALASVNSAQAALESQSIMLGYCSVKAPISGKITESVLDVGEYVSGEASPVKLATIYNDADLVVDFSIPESEYALVSSTEKGFEGEAFKEMPLTISSAPDGSDGISGFHASLIYEAPNVESTSGTVRLRAKVNEASDILRAGMYARIQFPVSTSPHAMLVRDASVSTDQRGSYLYTLDDSDKVVYTPVKTGDLYQDSLRLIKSGIKPDTRYVTRAMISVRSGEKVKPKLVN